MPSPTSRFNLLSVVSMFLLVLACAPAGARPLNNPGQTFVPGHYAWDARQRTYVWVPSHWERNRRGRESAGVGWTFSNGRWQFTPGR